MFSHKESEFLRIVARTPNASLEEALRVRFPNPVYRRKLMWGIRRKASRSLDDWQLYREAAERDSRLLPRGGSGGPSPLFADPLVTLIDDVRRAFARHRQRTRPWGGPASRRHG